MLIDPQEPAEFLSPHLDTILRVTEHFSKLTSEAAYDYSHLNPGWSIAWQDSGAWQSAGKSGKLFPINMMIALQQIVEDDPWTSEPLVANERETIIQAADDGEGESW